MNGTTKNHRKTALRVAIVVACAFAIVAFGLRFGNHFFVWLRMDKSLKAVPRVDVETLEKAGLDDVQFREHKIDGFVLHVPADAEEFKRDVDVDDEEDVEEDCNGDDYGDEYDDDDSTVAWFSVPSLKARLVIVVEKLQMDNRASFRHFMNVVMLGEDEDVNVTIQGEEGLAEFQARSFATSSADFRWSDTPSQVMDFAARCKFREWMPNTKQYFFERVNGVDVLIVTDSPTEFAMMVERRSHHAYYVTLWLEEKSADGVYRCFAFLRRMASFYANPPAQ